MLSSFAFLKQVITKTDRKIILIFKQHIMSIVLIDAYTYLMLSFVVS